MGHCRATLACSVNFISIKLKDGGGGGDGVLGADAEISHRPHLLKFFPSFSASTAVFYKELSADQMQISLMRGVSYFSFQLGEIVL